MYEQNKLWFGCFSEPTSSSVRPLSVTIIAFSRSTSLITGEDDGDGEGDGVTIKTVGVIRTMDGKGDGEECVKEGEGDSMGITGTVEWRIEIY